MNRRVQYWPTTGAYIVSENGQPVRMRYQNGDTVEARDYTWTWRAAA